MRKSMSSTGSAVLLFALACGLGAASPLAAQQRDGEPDERDAQRQADRAAAGPRSQLSNFDRNAPAVGEALPDVTLMDADGRPFPLKGLRGHYSVLVFGCLT